MNGPDEAVPLKLGTSSSEFVPESILFPRPSHHVHRARWTLTPAVYAAPARMREAGAGCQQASCSRVRQLPRFLAGGMIVCWQIS